MYRFASVDSKTSAIYGITMHVSILTGSRELSIYGIRDHFQQAAKPRCAGLVPDFHFAINLRKGRFSETREIGDSRRF